MKILCFGTKLAADPQTFNVSFLFLIITFSVAGAVFLMKVLSARLLLLNKSVKSNLREINGTICEQNSHRKLF